MSAAVKTELTPRQIEVCEAIRDLTRSLGRPPTIRVLMRALGISAPQGVVCHLDALVKKGVLVRDRKLACGIRFTGALASWNPGAADNGLAELAKEASAVLTQLVSALDGLYYPWANGVKRADVIDLIEKLDQGKE